MIALPRDAQFNTIQLPPSKVALAVTYNASISSASSITLNASTTYIEVTAIDKGVFLRYQASVSSTLYDEFIPQNTTHAYIIPTGTTVISVIQESATAKVSVIEK